MQFNTQIASDKKLYRRDMISVITTTETKMKSFS